MYVLIKGLRLIYWFNWRKPTQQPRKLLSEIEKKELKPKQKREGLSWLIERGERQKGAKTGKKIKKDELFM